jgi:hypothetical protein
MTRMAISDRAVTNLFCNMSVLLWMMVNGFVRPILVGHRGLRGASGSREALALFRII